MFTESQDELEKQLASVNDNYTIIRTNDLPLPDSRNALKEAGLKTDAEYFLLLDDDIVLPEKGLATMLFEMKKSDIAFCDYPYHSLKDGKMTGVTVYYDWDGESKPKGDIAWSGLGCVMVKRKVLESTVFRLSEYRFKREKGKLKMALDKDNHMIGGQGKSAGEDTAFYLEARANKFKIKCVGKIAKHLRIEKFVFRVGNGRYQTCHTIKGNDRVDTPEI